MSKISSFLVDSFLEFTDRSSISMSGSVTIADTAPYNQGRGCPLPGVQVCAVNHVGAKDAFICKLTNARGMLKLLPSSENVLMYATYKNCCTT